MKTLKKLIRIADLESERNRILQEELTNIGTQLKSNSPKLLNGEKVVLDTTHHIWVVEQISKAYEATGDYDVEYKILSNGSVNIRFSIKKDKNL